MQDRDNSPPDSDASESFATPCSAADSVVEDSGEAEDDRPATRSRATLRGAAVRGTHAPLVRGRPIDSTAVVQGNPEPVDVFAADGPDADLAILQRRAPPYVDPTLVGTGRFARVWRLRDVDANQLVAIKIPNLGERQKDDDWESARREYSLQREASGPTVVRAQRLIADRDATCIVLEYLERGTLESAIRGTPAKRAPRNPRRAFLALATPLAAVHRKRIVHGDVSTKNYLIDRSWTLKLSDFGHACHVDDVSRHDGSVVVLTPAFAAPELLDFQPATPASDVFSLGAVACSVLGGENLCLAETHEEFRAWHEDLESHVVDALRGVPEELAGIFWKCLARDPCDRYPDAGAVVAALSGV